MPTPTLDKLASRGLRYTQMHNTSLCSPTRAALLIGRNHHAVGYGPVAEGSLGYPGYDTVIGPGIPACFSYGLCDDGEVTLITDHGKVLLCRVSGLSTMGRATQVVTLMDFAEGEKFVAVARLAESDEE